MLERLVGLETEYVLRFRPREAGGPRLPNPVIFGRLLAIERKNLQLPMNGNGSRQETDFTVAGLIFQLTCDLDGFPIRSQ